jgi:hypothetical protein
VPDQPISHAVQQFIWDNINSVAQLEILLLLQTNPSQAWSPDAIARELRIETAGATVQLENLCSSNLAAKDPADPPAYRFAPANPALHDTAVALAQAYLVRRVTVIGLIFSKPSDNIRLLSDAFRFRKGPP